MRAVAGALAAVFGLLALGMVVIHQQGHYEALLGVQARRADFHAQMRQLYKLLQHPDALAEAVMGGAQQKQLRASKLRAVAAPTHKLEESGEDAEENYLHSSFPTTNRKGLGPGLSVGDPVLNKWMKYKMAPPACILSGNCVEEGYDGHDDWRNLKQVQDTVDEDGRGARMRHQDPALPERASARAPRGTTPKPCQGVIGRVSQQGKRSGEDGYVTTQVSLYLS